MRRNRAVVLDLLLVLVGIKIAILLGAEFDLFERWVDFTRLHEEWELDEVTIGAVAGLVGFGWYSWRRMRENARLRDEADQANKAKSDFLAAMSHELRTPLNAIVGFSEVIEKEILGPLGSQKYVEYANHIHQSGTFLVSLVEDILDLSRVTSGKLQLYKEDLDVSQITTGVIDTMMPIAAQRGVNLRAEVDPTLPPLNADMRAVTQVLLNLVTNAVKFSEPGDDVYIRAKQENALHLFEVRDFGCGMPPDVLETVLQPFVQHRVRPGVTSEGVGLGLAIVSGLIEAHEGGIRLESVEGVGTTVYFHLPSGPDEPALTDNQGPRKAA